MQFKFKPGDDAYHELWNRNCKIVRRLYIEDASDSYRAYDVYFPSPEGDMRSSDEVHERWLSEKRDHIIE